MKKYLPYIAGLAVIIIAVGGFSSPANAQGIASLFGFDLWNVLAQTLATLMNWLITGMSFVVALAGTLLNFSINLTLRISEFVGGSPAIFTTWKAIRDISGMVIIFFLLWAAIKMILGFDYKFGDLIKNIVIAGVLINFSFFFTSVGIDASNIVSTQLYNAIAPANSLNAPLNNPSGITSTMRDGGLSDIFMNSLDIQKYAENALKGLEEDKQSGVSAVSGANKGIALAIEIVLGGIVAVMIELIAALSFAAAALAFIVRFVVLLLLLAFSPIWFALHILPKDSGLGEYASKWSGTYKGMLLFMPVYLLLMYLALNVLNTTDLFTASKGASTGPWDNLLILGVNAVIVIVLINMPLFVAMSVAGKGVKVMGFINTGKLGAAAMFSRLGRYGQQGATAGWKNTGGRAASKIAQSEGFKNFAGNWKVGELALQATRATGGAYDAKLAKQVKSRTEFAESLGADQRQMNTAQATLRGHQQALASARAAGAAPAAIATIRANIDAARTNVARIESARKSAYADRTGGVVQPGGGRVGGGSYDTLYTYVARKNKVGAAKIQIPVLEKQLTQQKDNLKTTRDDVKQLTNAIRNNPAGMAGGVPALGGTAVATPAQAAQLASLQRDEVRDLTALNITEAAIDNLKLTT